MTWQSIPLSPTIEPFKGRIAAYQHNDPDEHVLLVDIQLGVAVPYAEAYKINQVTGAVTPLGQIDLDMGKDDSVTCWVRRNGTAVVAISEAIPTSTGGSGTTSGIRRLYYQTGAFPPSTVGSAGGDTTLRNYLRATPF